MKVLLASPRGFCAGVERAIEIVERALEIHGPPVYVRKEIVHNRHVVDSLAARGAVFVDELDEVPADAVTVFSAHGVSPAVRTDADDRGLRVIDATCPLVTKVHNEVKRFDRDQHQLVLVGHEGHEEVEGTMGEAPGRMHLVSTVEDVEALDLDPEESVGVLTQTTLSVDDTRKVIDALAERFPKLERPKADDICYATQNRQAAVKTLAQEADLVLVIGAENSSNSQRLAEVARDLGTAAHLIPDATHLDPAWLDGVSTVAVTAGASAPEVLVQALVDRLVELGENATVEEREVMPENVHFPLPPEVRAD